MTMEMNSFWDKRTCTICNSNNTSWLIETDHECYDCGGIY